MIWALVRSGNLTVAELARLVGVSKPTARKYLGALKSFGLAIKADNGGWALNAEVAAWLQRPGWVGWPGTQAASKLVGLSERNLSDLRKRLGHSAFIAGPVLLAMAGDGRGAEMSLQDISVKLNIDRACVKTALDRLLNRKLIRWSDGRYSVLDETRDAYGLPGAADVQRRGKKSGPGSMQMTIFPVKP